MTAKDCLILRHAKYITYMQIYAGFCLAIMASGIFGILKIEHDLFGVIIINNFVLAVILGILGVIFFRHKLKSIENSIKTKH